MRNLVKITVAAVVLLFVVLFNTANAAGPVHECMVKQTWKTIGVGAAYGAGVGALAGGVVLLIMPAGAVASPVMFVAAEAVYGGLIGAGGASMATAYQEVKGASAWTTYCVREVAGTIFSSAQREFNNTVSAVRF